MKYNKLVRDRIPEIVKQKGGKLIFHVAEEKEYWEKLKEKLLEEVREFSKSETEQELADVLEVIEAIVDHKEFDIERVQKIKSKKSEERGRFKKRIILEES